MEEIRKPSQREAWNRLLAMGLQPFEELEKKHEREIQNLQERCPHPPALISDWIQECWAVAHFTSFQVKICLFCHAEVKRRARCRECGKLTQSYMEGIGLDPIISGALYCRSCYRKGAREITKLKGVRV